MKRASLMIGLLTLNTLAFQNCASSDSPESSAPQGTRATAVMTQVPTPENISSVSCPATGSLTLFPQDASIIKGGAVPLTACNGKPPYTFSLLTPNGSGTIINGIYFAPNVSLNVTIQVTDADGATSQNIIRVGGSMAKGKLEINSNGSNVGSDATVPTAAKASLSLTAQGGVPPYTFVQTSGTGTVTDSTFTAPFAEETDELIVFDSAGNSTKLEIAVAACGGPNTIFDSATQQWTLTSGQALPWCSNIYPGSDCSHWPGSVPVINPSGHNFGSGSGQPLCIGIANLVLNPPVNYTYPQLVFTSTCPYGDDASCAAGWTVPNTYTNSGHAGQCELVTGAASSVMGFTFGLNSRWGLCF